MNTISLYLLVALFTWHWLADYTWLSTKTMLAAKAKGTPLFPIFCHALCHALPMWVIMLNFGVKSPMLLRLYALQLLSHFLFDVLKGRCTVWFPITANFAAKPYWIVMGFDQLLHSTVIMLMVYWAKLS